MSVAIQTSADIPSQQGTRLTDSIGRALWLADHVRICRSDCGTVLLDLRKGKYFALSAHDSDALGTVVKNWPTDTMGSESPTFTDDGHAPKLVADLSSAGLLAFTPSRTAVSPARTASSASLVAVGEDVSVNVRVRAAHVRAFTSACVWALAILKLKTFESLVRDLSDRKNANSAAVDEGRLIELVSVFRLLRPFAFTAHDRCLFHALALTRFLSYHKLFVTWTIGVRVNPWGAHSWVQHENLILDATPEKVVEFTPILTV